MNKEDITEKLNRLAKREPKRKLIWCSNCDCELVQPGTKCKNCGIREISIKRNKK